MMGSERMTLYLVISYAKTDMTVTVFSGRQCSYSLRHLVRRLMNVFLEKSAHVPISSRQ